MTVTSSGSSSFVKVVPASTIQLAPSSGGSNSSQEGSLPSLTALTVANSSGSSGGSSGHNAGTIVQYAHAQDGPFFVPGQFDTQVT